MLSFSWGIICNLEYCYCLVVMNYDVSRSRCSPLGQTYSSINGFIHILQIVSFHKDILELISMDLVYSVIYHLQLHHWLKCAGYYKLTFERIAPILEAYIHYFSKCYLLNVPWIKLMFFFFSLLLQLFFLGGRLIFGPDVRSLFLTICLIVIPVIFFVAAVCPQLGHEFHSQIGGWVASVAIIFTAYVSLWYMYTQFATHWSISISSLFFGFSNVEVMRLKALPMLGTTNCCIFFCHVKLYHSFIVQNGHSHYAHRYWNRMTVVPATW